MSTRWVLKAALVAVGAAALVGGTLPAASAASAASAAPPALVSSQASVNPAGTVRALGTAKGYQQLVDSVTAQVLALYPNAYLLEIDGASPTGPVGSIWGVTSWRFDFNASIGERRVVVQATVVLPSTTASINVIDGVWVGSDVLTDPVAMSPLTASVLLRAAGYRAPYAFVTYRQPIAGSFYPHPLFIFVQGQSYVGVDTVTGEVAPIA